LSEYAILLSCALQNNLQTHRQLRLSLLIVCLRLVVLILLPIFNAYTYKILKQLMCCPLHFA
jgi:hypothetical protein